MPNWCSNTITIRGEKEDIDRFESFLNEGGGKEWFTFFRPLPNELEDTTASFTAEQNQELIEKYGHSDWYSWSVENWGCKWNCDAQDWTREGDTISFWFDSPWAPPTNLYETIAAEGEFDVTAHYLEEGMGFVGRFADGEDEYYEYDGMDSLEAIPDEIVEQWDLRQRMMDEEELWEDEEENDEK